MRPVLLAVAVLCFASPSFAESALNDCGSEHRTDTRQLVPNYDLRSKIVVTVPSPLVAEWGSGDHLALHFIDPTNAGWYYGWDAPF
jgi:hypothetical protein